MHVISPIECKCLAGRGLFCFLKYPQDLAQCLTPHRHSANIGGINEKSQNVLNLTRSKLSPPWCEWPKPEIMAPAFLSVRLWHTFFSKTCIACAYFRLLPGSVSRQRQLCKTLSHPLGCQSGYYSSNEPSCKQTSVNVFPSLKIMDVFVLL